MISGKFGEQSMHIGDILRVSAQIVEGGKTRVQTFEGILIRMRGRDESKTFTVRRIGEAGVGVERTWPLDAKSIVRIEVKKKTTGVRRSKLYYLRDLTGKEAIRV